MICQNCLVWRPGAGDVPGIRIHRDSALYPLSVCYARKTREVAASQQIFSRSAELRSPGSPHLEDDSLRAAGAKPPAELGGPSVTRAYRASVVGRPTPHVPTRPSGSPPQAPLTSLRSAAPENKEPLQGRAPPAADQGPRRFPKAGPHGDAEPSRGTAGGRRAPPAPAPGRSRGPELRPPPGLSEGLPVSKVPPAPVLLCACA